MGDARGDQGRGHPRSRVHPNTPSLQVTETGMSQPGRRWDPRGCAERGPPWGERPGGGGGARPDRGPGAIPAPPAPPRPLPPGPAAGPPAEQPRAAGPGTAAPRWGPAAAQTPGRDGERRRDGTGRDGAPGPAPGGGAGAGLGGCSP